MQVCEVSALILCGGHSSRMGQNKAMLPLGGKTLLEHQIAKLRGLGSGDIWVSGHEPCPEGVHFVADVFAESGPLGGIHAGLLHIQNPAALVIPVDMPLLPRHTLRRLVEAHGGGITVLALGEQPQPLVAVYDKALAPLCASLLQAGKPGPRRLFELVEVQTVPFTGDPTGLMNCNTPQEFRQLQQIYAQTCAEGTT